MKYLIKDDNNNISILVLNSSGSIPALPGTFSMVEISDSVDISRIDLLDIIDGQIVNSLSKAKTVKLEEIRNIRDARLLDNDKAWLIAAKKKEDTSVIEAEAQMLRDLPTVASAHLDTLQTLEEINNYNPIGA